MSKVLAQAFLFGERNIKPGHDCENWAFMSILNHNLDVPLSPFGCLPSAVWVYMIMCGIYGCGQQNNNKLAHYKWFRGNCAKPLSPPLTVKQKRAIGYWSPKGEPCLCMGALYTPPPPLALNTQTATTTHENSPPPHPPWLPCSLHPLPPKHKYGLP